MPPILFTLNRLRLNTNGTGIRRHGVPPHMSRLKPWLAPTFLRIFGVTKDSAGAPLGSCTVHLFRTRDDVEVDEMISNGAGIYEFRGESPSETYYVVAYKPGSPDVTGATVNTLVGT